MPGPVFPENPFHGLPLNPGARNPRAGLSVERRVAALEERMRALGGVVLPDPGGAVAGDMLVNDGTDWVLLDAPTANGYGLSSDMSQPGKAKWELHAYNEVFLTSHVTAHNAPGAYWNIAQFNPSWSAAAGDGITWDAANSRWVVVTPGVYRFGAKATTTSFGVAHGMIAIRLMKNGSVAGPVGAAHKGGVSEVLTATTDPTVLTRCVAGDTITFQVYWTWGGGAASISLVTSPWTSFTAEWIRA